MTTEAAPERAKTRLDQWFWFARLVKSRSLAARLCAGGSVSINGSVVTKPNQAVRVGDMVVLPQGGWRHSVRVLALGSRRGPAVEARLLYEEAEPTARLRELGTGWVPLLAGDEADETAAGLTGLI